jgi:hypothetical protein
MVEATFPAERARLLGVLSVSAILVVNSGSCGEAEFEACQVAGSLPV